MVLWSVQREQRTLLVILAATLSFIDVFLFYTLSYLEHSKSLRPSTLLVIYLFFSLSFDAARARTLWLIDNDGPIRILFTASLAMKVVLLVLEAREKRRYLNFSDSQKGPEETSGILSQGIFWWLNTLIRTGFSKVLMMEDLYPIDERMTASVLGTNFRQFWAACKVFIA